jgi:hypothetical protein
VILSRKRKKEAAMQPWQRRSIHPLAALHRPQSTPGTGVAIRFMPRFGPVFFSLKSRALKYRALQSRGNLEEMSSPRLET